MRELTGLWLCQSMNLPVCLPRPMVHASCLAFPARKERAPWRGRPALASPPGFPCRELLVQPRAKAGLAPEELSPASVQCHCTLEPKPGAVPWLSAWHPGAAGLKQTRLFSGRC